MTICEHIKKSITSFTREILAMVFAFMDRRVRWYVKLVLVIGVLYIVSPYDLVSDTRFFWGQIDDLVVLRITYLIAKKIIDPAIMDECRERAARYLDAGTTGKLYYVSTIILIWGAVLLVIGRYLTRKIGR